MQLEENFGHSTSLKSLMLQLQQQQTLRGVDPSAFQAERIMTKLHQLLDSASLSDRMKGEVRACHERN